MGKRKQKAKNKVFSIGNKIFPVAKALAAPVAFLEQISAKHRQTMGSAFSNAPTTQKLKILTNIVTGSITGVNFFSNEVQAQQTINPAGVLNKWTNAGGLMIVYGVIGKHVNKMAGTPVIPATAKVKSIGKQVMIGGAVGGFFDDPPIDNSSSSQTGTRHIQLESSISTSGMGSSGSDSTESGM